MTEHIQFETEGDNKTNRRILRERADKLAAPVDEERRQEVIQVVKFRLCAEMYALEADFIQETLDLGHLTPLPFTPSFIAGIFNVRGKIYSLVDMKDLLGLSQESAEGLRKIIIMKSGHMSFGILVDSITDYADISESDLHPAPHVTAQKAGGYIRGVTKDRLVVLDALRILSDEKLVVGKQV